MSNSNILAFPVKRNPLPELPAEMIREALGDMRAARGGDASKDELLVEIMHEALKHFRSEPGNAQHEVIISDATVQILEGMFSVIVALTVV